MGEYKPNMTKCVTCVYWRSGAGAEATRYYGVCHHMLDTGKRRQRTEDNECLSYLGRHKRTEKQEAKTCTEI